METKIAKGDDKIFEKFEGFEKFENV